MELRILSSPRVFPLAKFLRLMSYVSWSKVGMEWVSFGILGCPSLFLGAVGAYKVIVVLCLVVQLVLCSFGSGCCLQSCTVCWVFDG